MNVAAKLQTVVAERERDQTISIVGLGQIVIWEGASLWLLEATRDSAEAGFHAHHAIQITFQLAGSFELQTHDALLSGPIVAVRSDLPHSFRASGAAAFLFIEPESYAGRACASALFNDGSMVQPCGPQMLSALADLRACFHGNCGGAELRALGRRILGELPAAPEPVLPDLRVQEMIAFAGKYLAEPLSLPLVAQHINLSSSRARHLFAEQTGLPFKTYVLWLRLERAVELYAAGSSLTEAAHEAGFADSSHFSRTFRRTFGVAAAELRLKA